MQDTITKTAKPRTRNKSVTSWFTKIISNAKKITWPTWSKIASNSATVVLLSALVTAFVWLLDYCFSGIVKIVLSLI